jgi:hypothetical protein
MQGYISAGLASDLSASIKRIGVDYSEKLFNAFCKEGLVSFGALLNPNSEILPKDKYIKNIVGIIEDVRKVKGLDLMIDSGGFQVGVGRIPFDKLEMFIDYYVDFLNLHHPLFEESFSLDFPDILPGGEPVMFEKNRYSYQTLIDKVDRLDKVLFVTHFRDVIYYKIWRKFIYELNLMDPFSMYSTGGLAYSQHIARKVPVNLYVIGVLLVVCRMVQTKKPTDVSYRFHMLGNSSPHFVLMFYLVKEMIKAVYGYDFIVSYDSTSSLKKAAMGRYVDVFDDKTKVVYQVNFRSANINKMNVFQKTKTNQEIILEEVLEMADFIKYDRKNIHKDIYQNEDDDAPMHDNIKPFIQLLDNFNVNKLDAYNSKISIDLVNRVLKGDDIVNDLTDIIFRYKSMKSLPNSRKLAINYLNSLKFIMGKPTIDDVDCLVQNYIGTMDYEIDSRSCSIWDDFDAV